MILLCLLLCIFWGEPGLCLEEGEGITFQGDIRHLAVGTHSVYITTDDKLYRLDHNLALVHSVTLRGVLEDKEQVENAQFQRVSETEEGNATLSVNVLLPFVQNDTLVICGVIDNDCGYCELLDPNDISKVLHSEQIQVGPPWRSSPSVSFLVNVTSDRTETYILTAITQYQDRPTKTRCSVGSEAVNLHNTNNQQSGFIFTSSGELTVAAINPRRRSNVDFVDGFQVGSTIFLLSNLPSSDGRNKVRLLWLQEESGKSSTLKSLRGATLRLSDGGTGSRLLASSVIPGGPPVLWSGVFSVDGGPTNTQLVLFDISPDLTGDTDRDPDFCFCTADKTSPSESKPDPRRLEPTKVLFRQNHMTSVLAVRHNTWMVFFIGTGDGQLIKLTVDRNYHTTCPRVLYRANDDQKVFPRIHLDPVDLKHVYVQLQSQVKRVPVSKCSSYRTVQDCWSAQDPYCVWCSSKSSCTFEDDCQGSDWLSIPEDFQKKMVSHQLMKDSSDQITLLIQTHLTGPQTVRSNFACQFSAGSGEFCSRTSPRPQFPQCTCIFEKSRVAAEDLDVVLKIRLGEIFLTEQLKISDCDTISGPPTFTLCRQCVEAGCGWSSSSCSWWTAGFLKVTDDHICQMESGMYSSSPQISSVTPSVVSFYGKNHALLLGSNLDDVTGVRLQAEGCAAQESPVWSNTGVQLTFHIPSTDIQGVVKACVVLPDDSCHGNAKITYQSQPTYTDITPSTSWASGKRKITLTGSHLEFVEGVVHSHALHEIRPPTIITDNSLIYDTPVSGRYGTATVKLFFKVANQTLAGPSITYYPDPEFTSFTATSRGDDISIIIEKKADKLNMTIAELSAWGVQEGKQYPCIMEVKETSDKTDYITCLITGTPDAEYHNLVIKYGDQTVTLGPPSLLHQVILTLRILLIPFIICALVFICCWQKKLTADTDKLNEPGSER